MATHGLHHVTAICSDGQSNIDFYTGVLGLRLVKVTVNFDDPASYHFYYGDALGRPGTILTFFVWPGARRGRHGSGSVSATTFGVPRGSLEWWQSHFDQSGVPVTELAARAGEPVLRFEDPDGLVLELVATESSHGAKPWHGAPIPEGVAIRGIHSVTLAVGNPAATGAVLTDIVGYRGVEPPVPGEPGRFRVAAGAPGEVPGRVVDLWSGAGRSGTALGAGVVHHVAFRVEDDAAQLDFQGELSRLGFHVSPVMDRVYFHSIYFREPGGVLFELATDAPGFLLDEPEATLGTSLRLPPWFEPDRSGIEAKLPAINVPRALLPSRPIP